jgi:hypothetical protein
MSIYYGLRVSELFPFPPPTAKNIFTGQMMFLIKKVLSGAMAEYSACSKKVKLLFIRRQSKKTVLSLQETLSRISLRTVLTSLYNAAARDRCLS